MENNDKKIKITIAGNERELTRKEMQKLYEQVLSSMLPLPTDQTVNFKEIGATVFDEYERNQDIQKGKEILAEIPKDKLEEINKKVYDEIENYSNSSEIEKYKLLDEIIEDMNTAYSMDYLTNGGISYTAIKKFKSLPTEQLIALKTNCSNKEYLDEIENVLSKRNDLPKENDENIANKIFDEFNSAKGEMNNLKEHKELKKMIKEHDNSVSIDYAFNYADEKFKDGLKNLSTEEILALVTKSSGEILNEINRVIGNRADNDEYLKNVISNKSKDKELLNEER